MDKVHFTEDVYVVYKRTEELRSYTSSICEEIERGLTYSKAIQLARQLNFTDNTLPKNAAGVTEQLYGYTKESNFDEYQNEMKQDKQLSLLEGDKSVVTL